MSFRRFVYCCAVCGAWSAFFGWVLGRFLAPAVGHGQESPLATSDSLSLGDPLRAGVLGMFLGMTVALGLSLLDTPRNLSLRQFGLVSLRVSTALFVGGLGGLGGGFIGELLYGLTQWGPIFLLGWGVVGLLVGASVGCFEVFAAKVRKKDMGGAIKKFHKCLFGGGVGGLLGGVVALALRGLAAVVFSDKDANRLLSPTALGFIALGACIGLLVGLAQVVLKEAWLRVEAGFRPGREMILAKESTSIGRAEGSDVALFGDNGVERLHAHILLEGGRYYLEEAGPTGGTFVNERQVHGRVTLSSGDQIRIGRSLLRFHEKQKRQSL